MFALSLIIYEIFAKIIKFQKFDLDFDLQVNEKRNGRWVIRRKMFDLERKVKVMEHNIR